MNTEVKQRPTTTPAPPRSWPWACAGIAAGTVVYLVNGQDFARAAIAAALWVAIGWYSGKAIFPRDRDHVENYSFTKQKVAAQRREAARRVAMVVGATSACAACGFLWSDSASAFGVARVAVFGGAGAFVSLLLTR